MKVLISVDLDGISGVVSPAELSPEGRDYAQARRWMTDDTNAAVEGALEGGATEVVVRDAHCQRTILYEDLHSRARLIRGGPGPLFTLDGLDDSFDGVLLVGYHARAGDGPGVMSHTYATSIFFDVRMNGESVSEARIAAALAGHFGVPVALVTGDDVICREVQGWLPGVETVAVKTSIDREGANCLPQREALARIRAGAERAVERLGDMRPYSLGEPVRIEAECPTTRIAGRMHFLPGSEMLDARTVVYIAPDFYEAHRAFIAMLYLGMSATR